MSRRSQQQPMETNHPDLQDDDILSGPGEGDEVMEEVEEQEGYSACSTASALASIDHLIRQPSPDALAVFWWHGSTRTIRSSSVINTYFVADLDQLVLFFACI